MARCRYCGGNIPDDGRFCPYCGKERSFLYTNYGPTPEIAKAVNLLSGTISTYYATGSLATAQAVEYNSPFLNSAVEDFRNMSDAIPQELREKMSEGEEAIRNYDQEIKRRTRAEKIAVLITDCNLLFQAKRNATLFRDDDPILIAELHSPCTSEEQYIAKLSRLAAIFEVDLAPLRALVPDYGTLRSIGLVKKWLNDNHIQYDDNMVLTWSGIVGLRNMPPLHATGEVDAKEFMGLLNYFGATIPIDYPTIWNKIVDKFTASLALWQSLLSALSI